MHDLVTEWSERIRAAAGADQPLLLRGGGSKDFLGTMQQGERLDTLACRGIVDYEPTELVLTARAGTPLAEIEAALDEQGQMLAFEPPHFGGGATLGGAVACGLSGPRRAAAGAVRDFVLGVRILDGQGRDLRFGGKVMKNVAGYDVSRLMAGAMGTLGLLLEVSLKVLPRPQQELTLRFQAGQDEAIRRMNAWAAKALPISATCHEGDELLVRLSGAEAGVEAAAAALGGERVTAAERRWRDLRDQQASFFAGDEPAWRLSVRSTSPALALPGRQLLEWNGALRWLRTDAPAAQVREVARAAGGHATWFQGRPNGALAFHPLPGPLMQLHARLKLAFDPAGILNRGRLYPDL